ncbi:uncharacterized protein [Periplaneta americana]|uniref:uncharacterized protein isoform X1 n=1 Tax=Periplaneta americana TaxID=6978 RepID=UPI0037E82A36
MRNFFIEYAGIETLEEIVPDPLNKSVTYEEFEAHLTKHCVFAAEDIMLRENLLLPTRDDGGFGRISLEEYDSIYSGSMSFNVQRNSFFCDLRDMLEMSERENLAIGCEEIHDDVLQKTYYGYESVKHFDATVDVPQLPRDTDDDRDHGRVLDVQEVGPNKGVHVNCQNVQDDRQNEIVEEAPTNPDVIVTTLLEEGRKKNRLFKDAKLKLSMKDVRKNMRNLKRKHSIKTRRPDPHMKKGIKVLKELDVSLDETLLQAIIRNLQGRLSNEEAPDVNVEDASSLYVPLPTSELSGSYLLASGSSSITLEVKAEFCSEQEQRQEDRSTEIPEVKNRTFVQRRRLSIIYEAAEEETVEENATKMRQIGSYSFPGSIPKISMEQHNRDVKPGPLYSSKTTATETTKVHKKKIEEDKVTEFPEINIADVPNYDQMSSATVNPQAGCSLELTNVDEGQRIPSQADRNMHSFAFQSYYRKMALKIMKLIETEEVLSFNVLCPNNFPRYEAALQFNVLLHMHADRLLSLVQHIRMKNWRVIYGPVYIYPALENDMFKVKE